MTDEQVLTAIKTIRYSPAKVRMQHGAIGIKTVADEAGVTTSTLYKMASGGNVAWYIKRRVRRAVETLLADDWDQDARSRAPETPKTSEPIVKYVRFR